MNKTLQAAVLQNFKEVCWETCRDNCYSSFMS